jgi:hypothetical protein
MYVERDKGKEAVQASCIGLYERYFGHYEWSLSPSRPHNEATTTQNLCVVCVVLDEIRLLTAGHVLHAEDYDETWCLLKVSFSSNQ